MAEQTATAMTRPPVRHRRRLGELLVDAGVLTHDQLQLALQAGTVANGRKERLGETVVRLGLTSDVEVARAVASQLGLEFFGRGPCRPTRAWRP